MHVARPGDLLQTTLDAPVADPLVPTVFHNRWWLEAASDGDYQEAEVRSDGRVIARLPYVIQRRYGGHRLCTMPELTHFLGPAIDTGRVGAANRGLRQFQITKDLLAAIAPASGFYHKLHRGIDDTLAFEDAGCTTTVQFTYEIAPRPEAELWQSMRDKTRNVIRRARERWQVITLDDPAAFAVLYETNLRRRGLVNHQRRIQAVCAAALTHDKGRILAVANNSGSLLGAIFIARDHQSAYYLLASRTPGSDNGVMSLLVWHAMRDAAASGLIFDFDGLGTPGSRVFYTGFGGRITPRFIASRYSFSHRAAGIVTKAVMNVGTAAAGMLGRHPSRHTDGLGA
jgi:hypothetical protein